MAPKTEKEEESTSASSSTESNSESSEATSSSTSSSTDSSTSDSSSEESESEVETRKSKKDTTSKKVRSGVSTVLAKNSGKRKRRNRAITICLSNCRYEIVRRAARKFNLKEVNEDDCWNIYWTDFSVSLERAMDMRRFQIVNHFPGMNEICRKDLLARNLNRMRKLFPKEYDIYPKTWSLPADLGELQTYSQARRNKTFICKPEMGCQGRGIFLIRNIKDLNPFGKIICQHYIAKPFLIDDLKFDLRIYVLMTSCDPLRVYVYKEGLARFATAKYKQPTNTNTENSYMHLTNYAVNKFSRDYVVDDEAGTKRKLTAVYRWLEAREYDADGLIEAIDSVILKTIISAHPVLRHNYRTCFPNHDTSSACFEILGFDILLDHKLKPYVLEVNHSPSFHTDARLDLEIKEGLVQDTLNMLNLKRLDRHKVEHADRKRVHERLLIKHSAGNLKAKQDTDKKSDGGSPLYGQFAYEGENAGGFRLIYPKADSEKYDIYFEQNMSSLYAETAASQARAQLTRNQIQDYNQKKQQEEIKRQMGGVKDPQVQKEKEKLRPESSASSHDRTILIKKYRPFIGNSFQPLNIDPSEELERMKGIMHRGMLVRSLGIEAQVFQLLCQVGTIKPEEERIFRRMHGFNNNLTTQVAKNAAFGSHFYQRKPQTAGGDIYRDPTRDDKVDTDYNGNIQETYTARSQVVTPFDRSDMAPGDKPFQTSYPHLRHGSGRDYAGIDPYGAGDKFPSQPDAYNSYTVMSQMRKQLTTAHAYKNTTSAQENDDTASTLLNAAKQLNNFSQFRGDMAPFRGESASVKQPSNIWNRYESKAKNGFYDKLKSPSIAPPKTGITAQSPSYPNVYSPGFNNPKTPARDLGSSNNFQPFKSIDGEVGPWKLGYPVNGQLYNEPIVKGTPWTPSAPIVTGHAVYNDSKSKSKIHKLIPAAKEGQSHENATAGQQHQRRGNVRGSSVIPKGREPLVGVTQMFEPALRADRLNNFFGHGQETQKSSTKGKFQKVTDYQQSLSTLMLTGIRIGTAPAARKYGH